MTQRSTLFQSKGSRLFVVGLVLLLASFPLFSEPKSVLLFSGSSRNGSFNMELIHEAAHIAKQDKARVQILDLKKIGIPHYDADVESTKGMPKGAQELREAMINSEIIVISTPEYNASFSGLLKDAIDWASRAPSGDPSRQAFKGKTFVLLSASPSSGGGKRAVNNLKAVVQEIGGTVCHETFSLPKAYDAFDADGHLKDAKQEQELQHLIQNALNNQCNPTQK